MYDNIGEKIKGLAKAIFIVGAVVGVITGIALVASGKEENIPGGLIVMVLTPFVAWVSSWLLYGFGELIDIAYDIARNTYGSKQKSAAQSKIDNKRIDKLEKLRYEGLITEEEYQEAVSKDK